MPRTSVDALSERKAGNGSAPKPAARYATILPARHKRSKTFEYIFNDYGTYASIFDYPKSDQQIGKINGLGGQGCTNVLYGYGKKTFWNVGGQNQIEEFRVPQKLIKTLSVAYSFPSSCAMDTSGDLAVGILYASGAGGGDVVIFKNASGSGTAYATPLDEEFFDGYDNQGNLFADGFTGDRSGFALVELPKGSTKFETITTSNSPEFPGSVQWDGTYLTVFDQDTNAMYQYTVSGTTATLKGTVSFSVPATARRPGSLRALSFARTRVNTAPRFSITRPVVHRSQRLRAISTCRSARWQPRNNLRFSFTQSHK